MPVHSTSRSVELSVSLVKGVNSHVAFFLVIWRPVSAEIVLEYVHPSFSPVTSLSWKLLKICVHTPF